MFANFDQFMEEGGYHFGTGGSAAGSVSNTSLMLQFGTVRRFRPSPLIQTRGALSVRRCDKHQPQQLKRKRISISEQLKRNRHSCVGFATDNQSRLHRNQFIQEIEKNATAMSSNSVSAFANAITSNNLLY
jgi:hypothetical protein